MKSQRQAVYDAITNVDGNFSENKEKVFAEIISGFAEGGISLADTPANREKLASPQKLRNYVVGLVNNWLRKDPRLNGGHKYVAKNPGSRAGSGDPQLRELKKLHRLLEGKPGAEVVAEAIERRTAEIAATKTEDIDTSVLPPELVEELGL